MVLRRCRIFNAVADVFHRLDVFSMLNKNQSFWAGTSMIRRWTFMIQKWIFKTGEIFAQFIARKIGKLANQWRWRECRRVTFSSFPLWRVLTCLPSPKISRTWMWRNARASAGGFLKEQKFFASSTKNPSQETTVQKLHSFPKYSTRNKLQMDI